MVMRVIDMTGICLVCGAWRPAANYLVCDRCQRLVDADIVVGIGAQGYCNVYDMPHRCQHEDVVACVMVMLDLTPVLDKLLDRSN